MKKLILISSVTIFTIFLSLSFTDSFSQSAKIQTDPNCTNSSRKIPEDSVIHSYARNYRLLVSMKPWDAAKQINFTIPELSCLSKLPTGKLKLIFGAFNRYKISTVFIIVEISENGDNNYYELDDMFPSVRMKEKPSSHLCPLPRPCPIPFL
jgi:hypothetical protein